MTRRWAALLVLVPLLLGVLMAPASALAQSSGKSVSWQSYDSDLTVQSDGSLNVSETQTINYNGTFQTSYQIIPTDRTSGIDSVRVSEIVNGQAQAYAPGQGRPGTYSVTDTNGGLRIDWTFQQTTNASRTFVISYVLRDAIAIYPGGDQLNWGAIYADRPGPVAASSVTVHLPSAADPNELKSAFYLYKPSDPIGALPSAGSGTVIDGQTVRFDTGPLPAGVGVGVRVQFPPSLVNASPPAWQSAADRADWIQQTLAPNLNFVALLLSIGLLAGGGVFLFSLWYTRGRDPRIGAVPAVLDSPPSDLPAPLAGTLVDEVADVQDAVATLVDLGERGFLQLAFEPSADGLGGGQDVRISLKARFDDPRLRQYERVLLTALFGQRPQPGTSIMLSRVRGGFAAAIPIIQERLSEAVQKEGLFVADPALTRAHYRRIGMLLAVAGAVLGIGAALTIGWASSLATLPGLALAILGVATIWLAAHMTRRTPQGALEAARWRAFRTYLTQTFAKQPAEQKTADTATTYLPYAIALGVDRSFLRRMEVLGSPPPQWYGSPMARRGPGGVIIVPGGFYGGGPWIGPNGGGGGLPMPNPGGMGGAPSVPSPQGWSDALAELLNAASGAMSSGGGSGGWSGGGWGGGGFGGGSGGSN